ncbi:MAG: CRISPR-associated protein Cas4 [Sulfolobales archaeon]|nr:CRISPR-associated protein Cas4 [Sulfolobales archaeon]
MLAIHLNKCLTPSMIKQYLYCPIIPWIMNTYNAIEPPTDSMKLGRERINVEGRGCIKAVSKLGSAVIDEVIDEGCCKRIVEHKAYKSRSIHRYIAQALMQYLIIREKIPKVRKVTISCGGKEVTLAITQDQVSELMQLINRLEKTLVSEKPPPVAMSGGKCNACWYSRLCPYR